MIEETIHVRKKFPEVGRRGRWNEMFLEIGGEFLAFWIFTSVGPSPQAVKDPPPQAHVVVTGNSPTSLND